MPQLRMITGPLEPLEDALAGAVAAARAAGPLAPVTVLAGHVLLRPYLRRALALRGVAQLDVRFVPPDELAARMAAAAGGAAAPRLTQAAERLLVREIADDARGYFTAIAGREGFAEALRRLFRELELGGFTAVGLARALHEAANGAPDGKSAELARLYASYERRRNGFVAPADHYRDALRASSFDGPLLVYGVWAPAELPARLIEHVASLTDVTVFLPVSGTRADDAHRAFRDRLAALGAEALALPAAADGDAGPPAVAARLFTAGAVPPPTSSVALVSAPDTVREVWEAARTCLDWARDGIRFHEMAVVYRNREPYRAMVAEIFDEAEVPAYLHDGRPLAEHPLGRRVLALLDLAADGSFTRAKVMEFLTETEVPVATAKRYDGVRASAWETYTREAGIVEGAPQWDARLARLAGEKRERAKMEDHEWEAEVADRIEVLRRFAREFHTALSQRPAEATWAEHLAYLRALAAAWAAGVEPVLDALDDLASLEAVTPRVTFDVFCRAVRDDLESRDQSYVLGEPLRRFGREGVAVVDASSLRHLRFRVVYMLGAAERAWPPPRRPDPLLLEHERLHVNAAGAGVLPLRTAPDDEPLTFSLAVQAARERLVVSYARADAGGSGKHLPSHFFRAVAEALEGRRLTIEDLESCAAHRRFAAGRLVSDEIGASVTPAEYDRGLVRAYVRDGDAGALAAVSAETPAFSSAMAARAARWGSALTPFDGCLTAADAVALAAQRSPFARGDPVSPSRLETYATCPYRFFMRYALGVEPVEEPETIERIDHLERGSLIHAILERFLRALGRDDPPREDARARHLLRLLAVAQEECAERERRGVTGLPLVWAMDQQQIQEDLVRWYDAEARETARSPLRPGAFEAAFGPVRYGLGGDDDALSSDEPLELPAEGRTVRLQGRIDRIDWDEARTRFRVIDYKTGKTKARAAFDRGRSLQLPIYLRAASQLLGIDPRLGEAQYFYVSSAGGFDRRTVAGDELVVRAADFERVLSVIAAGVDTGFFAPNPGKNAANCTFCDYKDVCDARIERIAARKDDARAAAYRALEEIE